MIARIVLLGLFTAALSLSTQAQVSLANLTEEADAGWMFGQWKATDDNGNAVSLNIAWELNKKIVILHVKTSEVEAKGYTVLEPGTELPTYLGADDRGAVSKGDWNYEDGELILRLTTSRPYETPRKWAAVFAGNATC